MLAFVMQLPPEDKVRACLATLGKTERAIAKSLYEQQCFINDLHDDEDWPLVHFLRRRLELPAEVDVRAGYSLQGMRWWVRISEGELPPCPNPEDKEALAAYEAACAKALYIPFDDGTPLDEFCEGLLRFKYRQLHRRPCVSFYEACHGWGPPGTGHCVCITSVRPDERLKAGWVHFPTRYRARDAWYCPAHAALGQQLHKADETPRTRRPLPVTHALNADGVPVDGASDEVTAIVSQPKDMA